MRPGGVPHHDLLEVGAPLGGDGHALVHVEQEQERRHPGRRLGVLGAAETVRGGLEELDERRQRTARLDQPPHLQLHLL